MINPKTGLATLCGCATDLPGYAIDIPIPEVHVTETIRPGAGRRRCQIPPRQLAEKKLATPNAARLVLADHTDVADDLNLRSHTKEAAGLLTVRTNSRTGTHSCRTKPSPK